MPIHNRPYFKIPYVVDGQVHFYTTFIEGLPALNNIPGPLLELYIKMFNDECKEMEKAKKKSGSSSSTNETSEERLQRLFNEKGIKV